jgi:hypothetical protein
MVVHEGVIEAIIDAAAAAAAGLSNSVGRGGAGTGAAIIIFNFRLLLVRFLRLLGRSVILFVDH